MLERKSVKYILQLCYVELFVFNSKLWFIEYPLVKYAIEDSKCRP